MNQQKLLFRISQLLSRFTEQVKILNSNGEFSINIHAENILISCPLKSPFLRDVVLTQYLANFLKHATKSFHGSFEVIDRSRQKNVHSISRHTLIKVAA